MIRHLLLQTLERILTVLDAVQLWQVLLRWSEADNPVYFRTVRAQQDYCGMTRNVVAFVQVRTFTFPGIDFQTEQVFLSESDDC
jgi:hypothetical protein